MCLGTVAFPELTPELPTWSYSVSAHRLLVLQADGEPVADRFSALTEIQCKAVGGDLGEPGAFRDDGDDRRRPAEQSVPTSVPTTTADSSCQCQLEPTGPKGSNLGSSRNPPQAT